MIYFIRKWLIALSRELPLTIFITIFVISNTFISNTRLKLAKKIKQSAGKTLRLNFCYVKNIGFFHPPYNPKLIENILKIVQKTAVSVLMIYD